MPHWTINAYPIITVSETPRIWYEFRNAVYNAEYGSAEKLLRKTPSLLHLTNGLGETVLHFLAVENDQAGVEWLHSRGAALNTRNEFGTPVLFEVAQLGYKELFKWFADTGADLQIRNAYDQELVEYLLEYGKREMAEWVRQLGT